MDAPVRAGRPRPAGERSSPGLPLHALKPSRSDNLIGVRLPLVLLPSALVALAQPSPPRLSFAVLTDIQYGGAVVALAGGGLIWNHEAVRRILESEPAVIAWFNGHDHAGGYAAENGIHYVTFPGMVECGAQNSYSVVSLDAGRIEIEGSGTAPSRSSPIASR